MNFWAVYFGFSNTWQINLLWLFFANWSLLLYPTQRVAEGIMFLTRPSVSPAFYVSATPLKPLNRISWNFKVMQNILCRCAYLWKFWLIFFSGNYAPFELKNLAKIEYTTETVCHLNSSVYICIYIGNSALIIFWENMALNGQKYITLFKSYETGLTRVHEFKWQRNCLDMFLTVKVQILHKCDNY